MPIHCNLRTIHTNQHCCAAMGIQTPKSEPVTFRGCAIARRIASGESGTRKGISRSRECGLVDSFAAQDLLNHGMRHRAHIERPRLGIERPRRTFAHSLLRSCILHHQLALSRHGDLERNLGLDGGHWDDHFLDANGHGVRLGAVRRRVRFEAAPS